MNVTQQIRAQAKYSRINRMLVKRLLNDTNRGVPGANPELRSLANTFSRYAQTRQTAYETGVAASSNGTTSVMERTVEHAIASVLGRSTGNDGTLGSVLQDVFPTLGSGQVATDPARSIVSAIGSDATLLTSGSAANLSGQISAEQAALYRQASTIIPDARRVVAAITPFAVVQQMDSVESLRGLIDQALVTLLLEFGRVDEPRSALVTDYLGRLRGPAGFVAQFGQLARVDGVQAFPDMYSDEQQIASFKLVLTYVEQLATAWKAYVGRGDAFGTFPLFTERLQRASNMLGAIAQGNINFVSAMDSVGFSEAERRSSTSRFEYLNPTASLTNGSTGDERLKDLVAGKLRFSTMTVYDYTEWVEKLARADGPRLLTDGGQAGLQFVTGQADTLFMTIAPVLYFAKQNSDAELSSRPIVAQVLAHERVTWAMSDLFNQLDVLADLAG